MPNAKNSAEIAEIHSIADRRGIGHNTGLQFKLASLFCENLQVLPQRGDVSSDRKIGFTQRPGIRRDALPGACPSVPASLAHLSHFMSRILNVYALPKLVVPEELVGDTAVVIDVLRASTTMVYALDADASEIVPCLEVSDAEAAAAEIPADERILGGERNGLPVEGFDLGNSPEDYSVERVGGKTVVFTTTNGTQALFAAQTAKEVLVAAFVNASAVVRRLLHCDRVHIICAGTKGQISDEDVLLAGLLVERLQRQSGIPYQQNAQAMTAREFWLHSFAMPKGLGAEPLEAATLSDRLRTSRGAQELLPLGLSDDILAASQVDRFDCVPRFDPSTRRVRLENAG